MMNALKNIDFVQMNRDETIQDQTEEKTFPRFAFELKLRLNVFCTVWW